MGKKNLSDTKVSNIKRLRELGYTVKRVAELTGVSMMTVNDYTLPGLYENRRKRTRDYLRRTTLGTGSTKQSMILHKHLNKRPRPEGCELCGRTNTMLYYHHWNEEDLNLGIWACFGCHRLAELVDKKGPKGILELMGNYDRLRKEVETAGNGSTSSKDVSRSQILY